MARTFIQPMQVTRSHYDDYVAYKFYDLINLEDELEYYDDDTEEDVYIEGIRFGWSTEDDADHDTVDIIASDSTYNLLECPEE